MTDDKYSPASLSSSLQYLQQKHGLPPVHSWNPDFCGDIDMRICSDGHWEYMGTPITRDSMVRLFSTVLRHDDDDCYYLVTPVEKVRIQVDDVPFIIVAVEQQGEYLMFTTNTGDVVVLNDPKDWRSAVSPDNPAPYIRVRDRLEAKVHRNVFYELAERAEERQVEGQKGLYLRSGCNYFLLGDI